MRLAAFPLLLLLATACARAFIPNTDVEDNAFNREVIDFCEQYRKAVERRNTSQLLEMADPTYYEDGGNADATDDLDYAGLQGYLETKFASTKAIRYEIRYRRVARGRNDEIYVEYTFSASYKVPTQKGDIWRRKVADNRLELISVGDSFRIISGM
ncbi:MAG: hypothetical protein JW751_22495 [Polyangiaceae bacterium]|nr:hypothetical protein [Polyangiaceae bacterium]